MSESRDTAPPKASEASGGDGGETMVCSICETARPALAGREVTAGYHAACIGAFGADYDPVDGHDAARFVARRAAWIEAETRAGRIRSAKIPVSDLLLHPDLAEEGN